jgi:hypothetical protein
MSQAIWGENDGKILAKKLQFAITCGAKKSLRQERSITSCGRALKILQKKRRTLYVYLENITFSK